MGTNVDLDRILGDIEMAIGPKMQSHRLLRFELDCFSLILDKLPEIAINYADLAKRYLSGEESAESLLRAEVACWKFLDGFSNEKPLDDVTVSAVRAAISILHCGRSYEIEDFVEYLSFFLTLVNRIEAHYSEEADMLRRQFRCELTGC